MVGTGMNLRSIWVFFHEHSRITGEQGESEAISFNLLCQYHLLHRHLDISWAVIAEGSPLYRAISWNRTGNPWFTNASH